MSRRSSRVWIVVPIIALVAIGANAAAFAINAATAEPGRWPGILDGLREHPFRWAAVLTIVTAAGSALLWGLEHTAGDRGGSRRQHRLMRGELDAAHDVVERVGTGLGTVRHWLEARFEGSAQPHGPEAVQAIRRATTTAAECGVQIHDAVRLLRLLPDRRASAAFRAASARRRAGLAAQADRVARRVPVSRVRSQGSAASVLGVAQHLLLLVRSLDLYSGAMIAVADSLTATREELLDAENLDADSIEAYQPIRQALRTALVGLDSCRADAALAAQQVTAYLREIGAEPLSPGDWRDDEA